MFGTLRKLNIKILALVHLRLLVYIRWLVIAGDIKFFLGLVFQVPPISPVGHSKAVTTPIIMVTGPGLDDLELSAKKAR